MRRNYALALGVIGLALLANGCKPSYVTAKTTVLNDMPNRDFTVALVQDTSGLSAPDQEKARFLRERAFSFAANEEKDLNLYGTTSGPFTVLMVAESQNTSGNTFPNPTEITIQTSGRQHPGETTNSGFAEIRFGTAGPVYTTNLADTFFEFQVADVFRNEGDLNASGTFNLIARNKDDEDDTKRLLVMDGAYIARVKN